MPGDPIPDLYLIKVALRIKVANVAATQLLDCRQLAQNLILTLLRTPFAQV
jgi:hypothetical protein